LEHQRLLVRKKKEERKLKMKKITQLAWTLRIWKDTKGQDLIEYALMAGFVAVAAGAVMPGVAASISTIFSKITVALSTAASQGS
jgi:pilus assembly protein Flp/PilA